MSGQGESREAIDAVVTWVDGTDPALAGKRRRYLADPSDPGAAETRFASNDEIVYCTRSILRFAPFFRRVWFVTDAQRPPVFDMARREFPDQADKLRVVDHREIFAGYEACLPSFNSMSIAMMLHRIPGLAERFVFFNDDFFLIRPLAPDAFFQGDRPVLRGAWMGRGLDAVEAVRVVLERLSGVRRFSSRRWMLKAARLAGVRGRTFVTTHAPYPMRRATLARFEAAHPDIWAENARHRFRVAGQFVPEALANHLEIAAGRALLRDRRSTVYLRADRLDGWRTAAKLARAEHDDDARFMCVQSLDRASEEVRAMITGWLDRRLGPSRPRHSTRGPDETTARMAKDAVRAQAGSARSDAHGHRD